MSRRVVLVAFVVFQAALTLLSFSVPAATQHWFFVGCYMATALYVALLRAWLATATALSVALLRTAIALGWGGEALEAVSIAFVVLFFLLCADDAAQRSAR